MRRRVERLREAIAQSADSRPAWINVKFPGGIAKGRVDIEIEWFGDRPTLIHGVYGPARWTLRRATKIAADIKPGRRFKVGDPAAWEEYR